MDFSSGKGGAQGAAAGICPGEKIQPAEKKTRSAWLCIVSYSIPSMDASSGKGVVWGRRGKQLEFALAEKKTRSAWLCIVVPFGKNTAATPLRSLYPLRRRRCYHPFALSSTKNNIRNQNYPPKKPCWFLMLLFQYYTTLKKKTPNNKNNKNKPPNGNNNNETRGK